jgi:hypothetical protein
MEPFPCGQCSRTTPYSDDWLDTLGRQSLRRLTCGLDELAPDQRIMFIFQLVAFAREEHLTLTLSWPSTFLFGEAALTYQVTAVDDTRSRVIVKLLIRYPFRGRWHIVRALFAWGDLIMMRKQLRTLSGLAELMAQREAATRR